MLMREFTKVDWYGWLGAERWPESDPHIYEPDEFSTVIADATGVAVHWFNPDGELVTVQGLDEPNRDAAITSANFIARAIEDRDRRTPIFFASLGFQNEW